MKLKLLPYSVLGLSVLSLLSACSSAPDFKNPAQQLPAQYLSANQTNEVLNEQQLSSWWLDFNDPILNQLIDKALTENTDIKVAAARVEQAQASEKGAFSRLLPTVGVGAQRQRYDGGNRDITFLQEVGVNQVQLDTWQAAVQASWEVDIFGANRARYQAASDRSEMALAFSQAVRINVAATVSNIYFNYRGAQLREQLLQENLKAAKELLSIAQSGFKGGIVNATDIDFARSSVELAGTQLSQAQQFRETLEYALENITMHSPGDLQETLKLTSNTRLPYPPKLQNIAVGQPIDLLYRRPDVLASQAHFNASLAQARAARRDYFPKFSLDAALSRSAYAFGGGSFNPANNLLYLGLGLVMPIFDFGARSAQVDLADAASKESWELLNKNILDALFDVERALVEIKRQEQQGESLTNEVKTREEILRKFTRQFAVGEVGRLDILSARVGLLNSRQMLLNQKINRLQTQVALYRALGGGWEATTQH